MCQSVRARIVVGYRANIVETAELRVAATLRAWYTVRHFVNFDKSSDNLTAVAVDVWDATRRIRRIMTGGLPFGTELAEEVPIVVGTHSEH